MDASNEREIDAPDTCDRCGCGRVPDDDEGTHWKTMRGRRVCRTCVYELALATAQTERWWSQALNHKRGA